MLFFLHALLIHWHDNDPLDNETNQLAKLSETSNHEVMVEFVYQMSRLTTMVSLIIAWKDNILIVGRLHEEGCLKEVFQYK